MNALTDTLTEINLNDLVSTFGLQENPFLTRLTQRAFRHPAYLFAQMMRQFDALAQNQSLAAGAHSTLAHFIHSLQVHGEENLPARGPVLYLSNHPGMVDTLALFSAINRPDLKIIALDRPFLRALPGISRHLFFVSEDPNQRMQAVRQAASHLRNGGAVLTFPAGKIEPDPAVYPGALDALSQWTEAAGLFLRLVPGLKVVPVMVSGVLWQKAVQFPLVRIKPTREEREKFGAGLQLLSHILFRARPLDVRLRFAQPIQLSPEPPARPKDIHQRVLQHMRGLYRDAGFE